jgi:hypothetical protein
MNWTGEMEILDEVRCAVKEECIRCKFHFKKKPLFLLSLCHSTIFHSARSIGILIFIYGFKKHEREQIIDFTGYSVKLQTGRSYIYRK